MRRFPIIYDKNDRIRIELYAVARTVLAMILIQEKCFNLFKDYRKHLDLVRVSYSEEFTKILDILLEEEYDLEYIDLLLE